MIALIMTIVRWLVPVLLTACGRIAFDPIGGGTTGGDATSPVGANHSIAVCDGVFAVEVS